MGKVEANVFPSPVFISTILPSCNKKPADNWVSKCFNPIVRLETSWTKENHFTINSEEGVKEEFKNEEKRFRVFSIFKVNSSSVKLTKRFPSCFIS